MEVQDLKMSGKDVYLHFKKHRVKCECREDAYVERLEFLDTRRVIYVIEGRKKEDLDRFFEIVLGKERCAKIRTVAMDLCSPYRSSVEEKIPKATLVFDKFHLMKLLHEQVDEVRKHEQERLEQEGKPLLKNNKWLLLKGQEKLREDQRQKLQELLMQNENISKSYILKEDFREFYRLDFSSVGNPADIIQSAYNYLTGWIERVKESGLEPLIKFTRTIMRWQNGVLAYFAEKATSALSEGLNNKISSIQKRAYGYRDIDYFILKIYQQCGAI